MKGLMMALLFSSQLLISQNNIAIFHANKNTVSVASTEGKAVSIAPFALVNGMIVVRASFNGELGNFILDTGSPGIVINSSDHQDSSDFTATSVGGTLEIGEIDINYFKWGIIEKKGLTGFTIDISHLEKAVGRKLAGLIGYEILEQYEVHFDYPNETVKIYSGKNADEFRRPSPVMQVPFRMNGHIPVIEVKVGHKKVNLGLDSGAEVNLLNRSYFKPLNKSFLTDKNTEKLVGLDQEEQKVVSAVVNSTKIADQNLPDMKFLFVDLKDLSGQFEYRFDGLLGFPFFEQHTVSINYHEHKIYIWN